MRAPTLKEQVASLTAERDRYLDLAWGNSGPNAALLEEIEALRSKVASFEKIVPRLQDRVDTLQSQIGNLILDNDRLRTQV